MPTPRQRITAFGLPILLILTMTGAALAQAGDPGVAAQAHFSRAEFQDDMRKLWEDHITWTRLAIVSFAAELDDLDPTVDRLLQNQTDIGDAITPFYGAEAGDALTALLEEHIMGAVSVLEAAKAGDNASLEAALEAWYANGDEIAGFLSVANPRFWPEQEMAAMMRDHLDLTLAEASARLAGDFEADIAAYDEIHQQILEMADMLSSGIISQFPRHFRR